MPDGCACPIAYPARPGGRCSFVSCYGFGWRRRQVRARTSSKSWRASSVRELSIEPVPMRRRRWVSTSLAEPKAIRQWWRRSRPDRPRPSARFAGTDEADRITWSAMDFNGAGTRITSEMAMIAASLALSRASNPVCRAVCCMVTSGLFMTPRQPIGFPGSRGRPPRAMHFTP